MKTLYLKNTSTSFFFLKTYWKVIELPDCVKVLDVTANEIHVTEGEDFYEEVTFIKTKLCRGEFNTECKEITREEFDRFFTKTVEKINKLSAI